MMSYVNCLDALSQAERLQQLGWLPAPKNWETSDRDRESETHVGFWSAFEQHIIGNLSPALDIYISRSVVPISKPEPQPGMPKRKLPGGKLNIKSRERRLSQVHRQPTTGTQLQQPVSPSGDVQRHLPLSANGTGIFSPPAQDWVARHLNYRYKLGA